MGKLWKNIGTPRENEEKNGKTIGKLWKNFLGKLTIYGKIWENYWETMGFEKLAEFLGLEDGFLMSF